MGDALDRRAAEAFGRELFERRVENLALPIVAVPLFVLFMKGILLAVLGLFVHTILLLD